MSLITAGNVTLSKQLLLRASKREQETLGTKFNNLSHL